MSAEYRFLRFEVVGIATIIFVVIGTWPLLDNSWVISWVSDADASLAVVASLFLLSLPIGYAEHQVVVNIYRSHKKSRKVFKILEDLVLAAQESCKVSSKKPFFDKFDDLRKNSFLTSILDLCIYSTESAAYPNVYNRLSGRWSHFYARRAVGKFAPIFSVSIWVIVVGSGYFLTGANILSLPLIYAPLNLGMSILWWIVIFILTHFVIDSYANKIWLEICYLETSLILASKDKIQPIIKNIVSCIMEHPEYIEQGESYGIILSYRL